MSHPEELRNGQDQEGKHNHLDGRQRPPGQLLTSDFTSRFDGGGREDIFHLLFRLELRFAIGEQVGHFAGRLEAVVRVLGVQLRDDAAQPIAAFRE